MPKQRFFYIYSDLREKIEAFVPGFTGMLPSENKLKDQYCCTRNTIRRAVQLLVKDGYVQSVHGRGVQVIYQPKDPTVFSVAGIESFLELAKRTGRVPATRVVRFESVVADEALAIRTGFPPGSELYRIERVRSLDGEPRILDINLFLKSETGELDIAIAEDSVYRHLENVQGMHITISKRRITAEKASPADMELLCLARDGFDFVSVITGQVFDANGVMFEFTQSRHRPDSFCFYDTAERGKKMALPLPDKNCLNKFEK